MTVAVDIIYSARPDLLSERVDCHEKISAFAKVNAVAFQYFTNCYPIPRPRVNGDFRVG